jgi:hypothetical protein
VNLIHGFAQVFFEPCSAQREIIHLRTVTFFRGCGECGDSLVLWTHDGDVN